MQEIRAGVACRVAKADARLQRQVRTIWGQTESRKIHASLVSGCYLHCLRNLAGRLPKGQPGLQIRNASGRPEGFDAAVDYYLKASKVDPHNANQDQAESGAIEAGQDHVHKGLKLREEGDCRALSPSLGAQVYDPSSSIADEEVKKTLELIAERASANEAPAEEPSSKMGSR